MSEVHVYGPAYLDRILRVARPLRKIGQPPIDRSVDGDLEPGEGLALLDEAGTILRFALPAGWPGPFGVVRLQGNTFDRDMADDGPIPCIAWHDDLGGMGAGYAGAFGGTLMCALGSVGDPTSDEVARLLGSSGVNARPKRIEGKAADWTLLISSGPNGDKLAAGFRGCHAALKPGDLSFQDDGPPRLAIVAGLPNPVSSAVLRAGSAPTIRVFAPAMRNMLDRDIPIAGFVESIDILACNRLEWNSLSGSNSLLGRIPLVLVTDGPVGAEATALVGPGKVESIRVPAFPRSRPPKDTNRAGEAFASALVGTLLSEGWLPGSTSIELLQTALKRGSAAAALVLDREDFGFPGTDEIDRAIAIGRVD
jgi:sugar/nucleoside kinase (ribokinase family)